ncbi:MAG: hypothetical protein Q8900_02395 [Bacillota bacterium]|nr:hypothetical protein [Bacillota bacterium]
MIKCNHQKRPDLFGVKALVIGAIRTKSIGYNEIRKIQEHLLFGDSQPAVVISKKPLIVAAYSEDIDCVVLLKFPDRYVELYSLDERSRLISINTYFRGDKFQRDITPGVNCDYTWRGYSPIIGEFITDDIDVLKKKKEKINEELWQYVYKLGIEYIDMHPNTYRDGRPILSGKSAL